MNKRNSEVLKIFKGAIDPKADKKARIKEIKSIIQEGNTKIVSRLIALLKYGYDFNSLIELMMFCHTVEYPESNDDFQKRIIRIKFEKLAKSYISSNRKIDPSK